MAQSRSQFTRWHSSDVEGGMIIGQGDTMVLLNLLIENRLLGQRWSENQVIF